MGRTANQFSTDLILASCAPGIGIGFGFVAVDIRIVNDGLVPIRFNLNSTNAATTNDAELKPLETFESYIGTAGLGLTTTSTTTSTGIDAIKVRVTAWSF